MLRLQHFNIRLAKGPQHAPVAFLASTLASRACWLCLVAWLLLSMDRPGYTAAEYIHFRRRRLQLRHPVRVRFLGSAELIITAYCRRPNFD